MQFPEDENEPISVLMDNSLYDIGIALSGGGIKGIAHLGVIQAMEDFGLKPGIISGVSAGAVVGALYADGHTPKNIARFFQESKFFQLAKVSIPKKGLISQTRFHRALGGMLRAQTFEELEMPMVINATDFSEGKPVYFSSGPLLKIIMASVSIPVVLNPVEMNGKQYVDGGIFCNLPARIIRSRCRKLIGVHVNPIESVKPLGSIIDIAERAYHLTIQSNTLEEKQVCDLVIEPVKARSYGMFEVGKSEELFRIGYEAAMDAFETGKI
jgi:NTE family protein